MIAKVRLWGRTIGAVSLAPDRDVAAFQYDPQFARSGIELSPLVMPLSERVYEFPALALNTFHGLPGLLVGFGTRLGSGCTSGHGVCGNARFSRRSLVATVTFMAAAFATVFVLRHVIGT